ncbi:MAG: NAD(+) synthase [Tannerella sp.]|nr:NAD(+) synthase [Tannerella sp.]
MDKKTFLITTDNVAFYAADMGRWIGEKVRNAGMKGVIFGMSGGVDCSVVARLCQLGEVDLQLVLMPYGDDMERTQSLGHAMELIDRFAMAYHVFDIKSAVDALTSNRFAADEATVALSHANLRPRVRMAYLYQLAQMSGRFVCGTGNLSERTVGYFTKWGDGGCDINPLAMLTKQEVYVLAHYLDLPDSIIRKQPSAGLWAGQTDEAEMGITYREIDAFILDGTSGNSTVDEKIRRMIARSAHKFEPIPAYTG